MIRHLRARTAAALTTAGGAALLATTLATPASAAINCPSSYQCVFKSDFSSSAHYFLGSDPDFSNDRFTVANNGDGLSEVVDNNFGAVSNSHPTLEAHYYVSAGYNRLAFCLNPGSNVLLDNLDLADIGSSLQLRSTSINCF